ncbi:stage III sporulation protein AE [Fervidicella metallireducens AeB]|uniref:Stage III sporulation protein AE n=1 Tax=Fervidicella metallireducens AeB TaxID=1403537 RepID=A0A017RZ61_9CLOT|nr:stage III sporulation protein AE [Fervidicella metallireducens]EYE89694.1 stage III sporulation protein AE [Fervidicella metallireducens AeB]
MGKKIFYLLIILFLCVSTKAYAISDEQTSVDISKLESFAQSLQQEVDYLPEISFSKMIESYKKNGSLGITVKDFTNSLLKFMFKEILLNSKLLVELLFIGIFCALLQNIQNAFSDDGVSKIAYYACFLVMVVVIIKSFSTAVQLGQRTISNMVEFMNSLMPPLIVLIAAVGGFASAATLDPIVMFILKVTSDIIRDLVLPLTILVVVINIVDNLSDSIKISKLGGLIKQVSLWVLGFIMTIFVGIVTIRSNASATIDQVALKSAKFAVDNFIPIVGKCLSDAITTVAGYSLVLKDAISIGGLLVMIFICVFPLIKIIILALIYKFVGAVMEPVVDKRIVDCLSATGSSLTMIFICVLSVAIMFFIMITIVASTGKLVMMVG